MKILITGATGFIGSHLLQHLIDSPHERICLVRNCEKARQVEALGCKGVVGDVTDFNVLKRVMQDCDQVFHLANVYSMWLPDNYEFDRVNILGTQNVMEAALQCGVKRVVYLSTVAVFGSPDERPFHEKSIPGTELFSAYARSKAKGDNIAWRFAERGVPMVVLYPGIVLGAGDKKPSGQYILDLIRRRTPSTIFHQSEATYVYVRDVVQAILAASQQPDAAGKKYLIGKEVLNGEQYADLICTVAGVRRPPFRFPDWMVMTAAYLLTGLSSVIGRAPWWGLSIDAAWTLKKGFVFDGSLAERELGLTYTPIQYALQEAVKSYNSVLGG